MKELTDRLAITGTPVTEEDQCYLLIRSLPQSYGYLIPVLCAPKVLDLGTVTNGIVKQEMRTVKIIRRIKPCMVLPGLLWLAR